MQKKVGLSSCTWGRFVRSTGEGRVNSAPTPALTAWVTGRKRERYARTWIWERENALPQMILYNVNPADNYVFATAAGSFQDGAVAGKIQYGSAWWFLDQKHGIEQQLSAL